MWAYLGLGALWLGGAFAISLAAVIGRHVTIDSSGGLTSLDDPAGANAWWGSVQAVFFPAVAVCWLVWLAGQVLSYRRSSGERRLQLKWLLSGATVFIVAAIGLVWLNNPTGVLRVLDGAAGVGTLALPVSIGFGIMKFRFHSSAAMAASTLVAAALFNPVRRRVQRTVDRRFNRARYDADQTVAAFAARLQDAVDLGTVHSDLLSTVGRALEPAHVTVWTAPLATASRPG